MQEHDHSAVVSDVLPRGRPRSLAWSILVLPWLYVKAIFAPTARFFAEEGFRASWPLVFVQLLLLFVIPSILGYIRGLDRSAAARDATNSVALGDLLAALAVSTTVVGVVVQVLLVPLLFFFNILLQFILAKIFRGYGRFVSQTHTMLLYHVPLSIVGNIINTVLVVSHIGLGLRVVISPVVSLALLVYGALVNIVVITGVHRLPRRSATFVVVLTYVIFALIAIVLVIVLARAIVSALQTT